MQASQSSYSTLTNRSAVFPTLRNRARPSEFDVIGNLGVLSRSARDADTLNGKETVFYQFRLDRVSKVRTTLENRLRRDPVAGFFRDRSLFSTFLDADGRRISPDSRTARPEDSVTLVSRRLSPGTYYLRLRSNFSGDLPYRIEFRRLAA